MYSLHLQSGNRITSAELQHTLGALQLDYDTETNRARMAHLSSIERLEARGISYANQDFDVLSRALNFLDAVAPEHQLRG